MIFRIADFELELAKERVHVYFLNWACLLVLLIVVGYLAFLKETAQRLVAVELNAALHIPVRNLLLVFDADQVTVGDVEPEARFFTVLKLFNYLVLRKVVLFNKHVVQ